MSAAVRRCCHRFEANAISVGPAVCDAERLDELCDCSLGLSQWKKVDDELMNHWRVSDYGANALMASPASALETATGTVIPQVATCSVKYRRMHWVRAHLQQVFGTTNLSDSTLQMETRAKGWAERQGDGEITNHHSVQTKRLQLTLAILRLR